MHGDRAHPLVVLLAIIALVAGCTSAATPSPPAAPTAPPTPAASAAPTPVASPVPTPAPTPVASPMPSPTPSETDPFVGKVAVTVSDDLVVRSEPWVGADSEMYRPGLPLGTELTVLDGPVSGSGYTWYEVAPVSVPGLDGPGFGWVAMAARDGEPWIAVAESGEWQNQPETSLVRFIQPATRLRDGRVLVSGMRSEVFDPQAGTWRAAPSQGGSADTATLLTDGRVLAIGRSVETYDPDTNRWSLVAGLTVPRNRSTATLLPDGRVLVVGGLVEGGSDAPGQIPATASVELLDPETGQLDPAAPLALPRWVHQAVSLADGRVLVAGGETPVEGGAEALATATLYDEGAGRWTETGAMTEPRFNFTLTLLPSGKVLATGGVGQANDALASAELYDPVSGMWAAIDPMSHARFLHSATVLPSGDILIAGGANSVQVYDISSELLRTAEILDPVTRRWHAAPPMTVGRYGHAAVGLEDGKVMVIGGQFGWRADEFTVTVERFVPAVDR